MIRITCFVLFGFLSVMTGYSQNNVGIGTSTPDPSSVLDIRSNDKGFLMPRINDTSSVASPATGLLIYQVSDNVFYYFDGTYWRGIGYGSSAGTGSGATGPTGPAGAAGPTGAAGATGPTGASNLPQTLQKAYDGGGSGLGRLIDLTTGKPVHFRSPSYSGTVTASDVFAVSTNNSLAWAINGYTHSAGAGAAHLNSYNSSNIEPTLDVVTNSNVSGNSAILAESSGLAYAIRGQSSTTDKTIFATNSNNGNNISVVHARYGGSGTTNNVAVLGEANSAGAGNGTGVSGNGGYIGVRGEGGTYAGRFFGNVDVVGNISKSGGSFKIDHPMDPSNKYLYHSFVESPDMMNIYNGNVTTNSSGVALVELPDYFTAINKDFRYQLTVMGTFAQAIVSKEMEDGKFEIQTSQPNVKVSWMITGIRRDPYAEANRIQVEVDKDLRFKGTYLHPELYGMPEGLREDFIKQDLQPKELKGKE